MTVVICAASAKKDDIIGPRSGPLRPGMANHELSSGVVGGVSADGQDEVIFWVSYD